MPQCRDVSVSVVQAVNVYGFLFFFVVSCLECVVREAKTGTESLCRVTPPTWEVRRLWHFFCVSILHISSEVLSNGGQFYSDGTVLFTYVASLLPSISHSSTCRPLLYETRRLLVKSLLPKAAELKKYDNALFVSFLSK